FTPTANTALWEITRPPLRILSCRASTITNGYATASSERSFHSLTMGSRALHHSDTVDLEKLVPHNSSVIRRTFRVDTPLITISINLMGRAGPTRIYFEPKRASSTFSVEVDYVLLPGVVKPW